MKNIGTQETNGLLFDAVTGMPVLDSVLQLTQGWLRKFAASPEFMEKIQLAFGDGVNVASLQDVWASGSLGTLPEIEVRPATEIDGANGAFAAETETIYLSQELINNNGIDAIARVFLEEYGHYLDSQINNIDTVGDEGALFSELALGQEVTGQDLANFQQADDHTIGNINGQEIEIETFVGDIADTIVEKFPDIGDAVDSFLTDEPSIELSNLDSFIDERFDNANKLLSNIEKEGKEEVSDFATDLVKDVKDEIEQIKSEIPNLSGLLSDLGDSLPDLPDLSDLPDFYFGSKVGAGVNEIFTSLGLSVGFFVDTDLSGEDTEAVKLSELFPDILVGGSFSAFGLGFPLGAGFSGAIEGGFGKVDDLLGVGDIFSSIEKGNFKINYSASIEEIADAGLVGSTGYKGLIPNSFSLGLDVGVGFPPTQVGGSYRLETIKNTIDTNLKAIPVPTPVGVTLIPVPEDVLEDILELSVDGVTTFSSELLDILNELGKEGVEAIGDLANQIKNFLVGLGDTDLVSGGSGIGATSPIKIIQQTGALDFLTDLVKPKTIFSDLQEAISEIGEGVSVPDLEDISLEELNSTLNLKGKLDDGFAGDFIDQLGDLLDSGSESSSSESEGLIEILESFDLGVDVGEVDDLLGSIIPSEAVNFVEDLESSLPESFSSFLPEASFSDFVESPIKQLQKEFTRSIPDSIRNFVEDQFPEQIVDPLISIVEEEEFAEFNVDTGNPQDLANALLAPDSGIAINSGSINFQGGTGQTSFYNGGLDELGILPGILLTSGDGTPPLENTSPDYTTSLDLPGDPDLDEVADNAFPGSGGTNDANTLEFSFNIDDPSVKAIKVSLVFGSEEFPEFSNSPFVDVAAVLVNGENVAFFDQNENQPLSVIDVNLEQGNFINNQASDVPDDFTGETKDLPIEYDGVSSPLTIIAPVKQGENTIKFGVADTGDTLFDSGLFVSNLQSFDLGSQFFDLPQGTLLLDLTGTEGADDLTGTEVNEFIDAGGGDDTIDPGAGNDFVSAGAGDDTIQGGQGNNQINGGPGTDTVIYSTPFAETPIQVNQDILTVGSGTDTLTNIEFLQFTDTTVSTTFLDTLSLTATDAEQPEGDDGTTSFTFTVTRPDNVTGDVEFNYEVTGSGDNPANADDFLGNVLPSGTVTFTGEETEKQITVDVTADTVVEPDEAFTLTLSSPDAGDDVTEPTATATIINDDEETEPNEITGTAGRDELTGTSENDSLTGGFGADILTGEGGSDQFVYESIRDAGDTITDFEIGSDQIVLTGVLDSFGYDGSDALADGYVQVVEMGSNSAVQIDSDGPDGRGIFRPFILVENVAAADLSAASNFAF